MSRRKPDHKLGAMFADCLHGAMGCDCECACPCATCTDERAAAQSHADDTARDIEFYAKMEG